MLAEWARNKVRLDYCCKKLYDAVVPKFHHKQEPYTRFKFHNEKEFHPFKFCPYCGAAIITRLVRDDGTIQEVH
jgi:hypothetical protein